MYKSFRNTLLSLTIPLSLACYSQSEAGGTCPAIEMKVVADTPTDSTKAVALGSGDITGARASQEGDGWAVKLTVNDAAAKRVEEFTRQHVGRDMAMVVDGKAHGGTPRITGAVTGNQYRIDASNRADAEQLATAIKNGCVR